MAARWSRTVLTTPELRQLWEDELAGMRVRIKRMRDAAGREAGRQAPAAQDFDFVARQRGMFSYSGLTKAQVDRLRDDIRSTRSTPAASASPR